MRPQWPRRSLQALIAVWGTPDRLCPTCVQEVDAYWLQRRIAQAYGNLDAAAAQELAEEVLQRLQARTTRHH